jgi:hypothetical protein
MARRHREFEGLSGEFEIHPNPILASETWVQASGKKIGSYKTVKAARPEIAGCTSAIAG